MLMPKSIDALLMHTRRRASGGRTTKAVRSLANRFAEAQRDQFVLIEFAEGLAELKLLPAVGIRRLEVSPG